MIKNFYEAKDFIVRGEGKGIQIRLLSEENELAVYKNIDNLEELKNLKNVLENLINECEENGAK